MTRIMHMLATIALALAAMQPAGAARGAPIEGSNGMSIAALAATRPAEGGLAYDIPAAMTDDYLRRVRATGVVLARLVTRPAPMMTGTPEARARATAQVIGMTRRLLAAGMTVIVDPHHWPPDTDAEALATVCDAAGRERLRTMLLGLAGPLAAMPRGRVVLELLNEPKRCKIDGRVYWPVLQRELVTALRARHPTLPLLVTGTWEGPDALAIDPLPYRRDPNILFSWHFYDPFMFTHQEIYYKLGNVPFPAPGNLAEGMKAYAEADRSQASPSAANDLRRYLTQDGGEAVIARKFAAVGAWARSHGIAPGRIVIGEYGAPLSDRPANATLRDDEARWIAAVRGGARREGFSTIFWILSLRSNFDTDAATRFLRPDLARAIGLRPEAMTAP